MSLTSILKDFAVRAGLIVEGTNNVTSSTGMTGTLQVDGGAAIAKDSYIGGSVHVGNSSTVYQDSHVLGSTFLRGVTATGNVSITSSTQATTTTGALSVTGGVRVGDNLVVNSVLSSTATVANNALFVQGGVGVSGSLFVQGDAVFQNDVVFSGDTTYVYTTQTVYTDNLLGLHIPAGGGPGNHAWNVDDGLDIGLVFHYYKGSTDNNAFLGWDNTTGFLEWYDTGTESGSNFTGSTYGTFKTGGIRLTDATSATTTASGALQVQGGIGAENIYLNGNANALSVNARNLTPGRVVFVGANGQLSDDSDLTYDPLTNLLSANISSSNTATDLAGGATGSIPYQLNPGDTTFLPIGSAGFILVSTGSGPAWATSGAVTSGEATTATNLKFGEQYQIPYQTAPGSTAFEDNFKYRFDTDTLVTVNAQFTGTSNAVGPASGAIQIAGGAYIAQDIYLGGTLAVLGGSIKSVTSSFDLLPTTATTVNFASSATALTMGWINGTTTIRNVTTISTGTDATSTADGALVVTGGVGIGKKLFVGGNTDINGNVAATGSFTSTRANNTADGAGQIYLNGATGNRIDFNNQGTAAPAFTTRSVGTKLVLYPALSGVSTDYAVGVDSGTFWSSVPGNDAGQFFKWYGGATEIASLSGTGALVLTGSARFDGNISVNGGDITSIATTFNLINTTATNVNFAGAATALTIGATTGFTEIRNATTVTSTTAASSTNTGALQVVGGVGIGGALYVGGNTVFTGDIAVNGGDVTTDQTTFNLVNTNATTVNIAGAGTAVTIGATTGYTQIRNATTVTDTTNATSTNTGALQVQGGIGVANSVWIGNALRVIGATTLNNLNAAVTTATQLTVNGTASVSGIIYANDASNANAINNGSIQTLGGIGVAKDVYAGGAITAGATQAATTGTVVNGFYTNNTLIASFTSNVITGTAQANLDFWSSTNYRSARYFVQITDGADVHVSEISLFHDGVKAYINEYGIATNNGQLGSFDATLGAGNVTVKFTPTNATAMTIKMVRTTISA
jgi:hypothetical protein